MPKICYITRKFSPSVAATIDTAIEIIAEYDAKGFDLTLRQLYYQFVARGLLPNKQREYSRLGVVINAARHAGLIDWDHIQDRTRFLRGHTTWGSPAEALIAQADRYREDLWATQTNRVQVWIEKDALVGVIENVCDRNAVDYLSCRGYTSASEVWRGAVRCIEYARNEDRPQQVHIIHLGDHDPSGVDMSRDIHDRLRLFCNYHGAPTPIVHRVALNMDQVEQYKCPPNPAKITDSRATKYIAKFGKDSWELDALNPDVIDAIVQEKIDELKSKKLFDKALSNMKANRQKIAKMADGLSS